MKKHTLGIIATCALCLIPSTAYSETSSHSQTQVSTQSTKQNATTPKYPGHPIKYGSQNIYVKEIQQRLNQLGYNVGSIDGIFGVKTLAEVKHFQKSHGLTVNGIVGASTWYALFSSEKKGEKSNNGEKPSVATGGKTAPSTQENNAPTILGPSIINATDGDNILIQYTVKNNPYANNWATNPESIYQRTGLWLGFDGLLEGRVNATGTFHFEIHCTVGQGVWLSKNVTLNAFMYRDITTLEIPKGRLHVTYPPFQLKANHPPKGLKWWVASGHLPPGLHLSSTGILSGKPTKAGTFTVEIGVTYPLSKYSAVNVTRHFEINITK